jgi:deazaflavin-dependent oxidoreductase (nitroreductase family)
VGSPAACPLVMSAIRNTSLRRPGRRHHEQCNGGPARPPHSPLGNDHRARRRPVGEAFRGEHRNGKRLLDLGCHILALDSWPCQARWSPSTPLRFRWMRSDPPRKRRLRTSWGARTRIGRQSVADSSGPAVPTPLLSRSAGRTGPDVAGSTAKQRVLHPLQKSVVNPLVKLAWGLGIPPPGDALLKTTGRRTGQLRRTPICDGLEGKTFWLVAQQGRRADYVRNIQANPRVRVKVRRGWRTGWRSGTAHILDDDDRTSASGSWVGAIWRAGSACTPPGRWARVR